MANGKAPWWQYVADPLAMAVGLIAEHAPTIFLAFVLIVFGWSALNAIEAETDARRECRVSTCSAARVPVMLDRKCVCMEAANGKR